MTDQQRLAAIRQEAQELEHATWLGEYPLDDIQFLLAHIEELEALRAAATGSERDAETD